VVQLNATTVAATTGNITTVNATTVDTTNIEVTNLKAKDGTAAGSIADSTGVVTLTTLASTTGNITTVNATTVDTTNIEVTNLKAKDGTAAGSIADSTGVVTLASSVLTTTDINGGTIDGAVIGGASAAAGSFTSLTDSGNLTFTGTGNRITGDFSNATVANRVAFQSSTTNSASVIGIIPNGTSSIAAFDAYNNSDPTNAAVIRLRISSTDAQIQSAITGTGTYLPMTFFNGGSEAMRITTDRNVGIGTVSPATRLEVSSASPTLRITDTATAVVGGTYGTLEWKSSDPSMPSSGIAGKIDVFDDASAFGDRGAMRFYTNNSTSLGERMQLSSQGNLGVGVTPSAWGTQFKALQSGASGNSSSIAFQTGEPVANILANAYYDGSNYKYINSSQGASQYRVGHNGGTIASGFAWSIAPSGTAGNTISFTQAMTLDTSGNLLVGTTSPSANSQSTIVGASVGGTFSLAVIHNAADNAVRGILSRCPNYSGDHGYLFIGNRVVSDVIYIKTNGDVLNLNNSYGALSDIKLKENIVTASPKLDKLMQVEIVNYNLKDQPEKKLLGVVAQQLEQIFPGMVEETSDRDVDGKDLGTKTKSVKYSVFVPMLIKAIQEQQALIQDLTTRLNTLEGN
jgi:hypothetical protein